MISGDGGLNILFRPLLKVETIGFRLEYDNILMLLEEVPDLESAEFEKPKCPWSNVLQFTSACLANVTLR